MKPLNVGLITAPNCQAFYGVLEDNKQPERLDSTEFSAPGAAEIVCVRAHDARTSASRHRRRRRRRRRRHCATGDRSMRLVRAQKMCACARACVCLCFVRVCVAAFPFCRYAVGHQHVGAINISLFVNDKFVCASHPTYGRTPGKAGDEQGYLVAMSACLDKSAKGGTSLTVAKGDKVRLDSWYWVGRDDPRIYPLPGGTHLNVMGYMYVCACRALPCRAVSCRVVSEGSSRRPAWPWPAIADDILSAQGHRCILSFFLSHLVCAPQFQVPRLRHRHRGHSCHQCDGARATRLHCKRPQPVVLYAAVRRRMICSLRARAAGMQSLHTPSCVRVRLTRLCVLI